MKSKARTSFTLIELISVILVMALLLTLALHMYTRVRERASMSIAKEKLSLIRKSMLIYQTIHRDHVEEINDLTVEFQEIDEDALNDDNWTFVVEDSTPTTFEVSATRLAYR